MHPIAVELIPKLPKPAQDASKEDLAHYEQLKALNSPGAHAVRLLKRVREHLDTGGHAAMIVRVCGDGDYSNASLLPHLPPRTVYIGRTRSDIHLRAVPRQPAAGTLGRPCSYGEALPTPQALYKDKRVTWEELSICNGPARTQVRYKRSAPAKWPVAGERALVAVVVIAPLRYKKRKDGPWQYTEPAYLVCTDVHLPIEALIQSYFWRWGIEVNFKEEKQLFGTGQAQVRNAHSVSAAPAVCIATYAALLLAGIRAYGFHARPPSVEPPKWYARKRHARVTASDLTRQLHQELLLNATGNFSPLALGRSQAVSGQKLATGFAA
jgi:hypothetical protein